MFGLEVVLLTQLLSSPSMTTQRLPSAFHDLYKHTCVHTHTHTHARTCTHMLLTRTHMLLTQTH